MDYWQRQTPDAPLFPDLLWSRPENRAFAGKLLIAGGNAHGFAAPAEAYAAAQKAGIGVARVLLPDSLRRTVGMVFEAGEYAPSTPSGSFSQKALAELLSMANWADGVLLDGDMGRNSETAIVLERFITTYTGQLTVSNDAADYFLAAPEAILSRADTLLALSFGQAQKLFMGAHAGLALTSDMDLVRLVGALHHFSLRHNACLLLVHGPLVLVAVEGQVSSTTGLLPAAGRSGDDVGMGPLAAAAAVWWLQNSGRPFQAISTSLVAEPA